MRETTSQFIRWPAEVASVEQATGYSPRFAARGMSNGRNVPCDCLEFFIPGLLEIKFRMPCSLRSENRETFLRAPL